MKILIASRRLSAGVNKRYFDKVLVANRGEIACRVFRTLKRLDIRSVAVHSTVDSAALHVRNADEAVCLGGPQSATSYLDMEKIIAAMKQTGAQAVHPGYGFLSENAGFAKRLEEEGLTFIGPSSFAIHAMGDKLESKKLAKKAGVNVIPGFQDVVENEDHAVTIAREIGYPVMIKASAGGGGKGMRIAWNDDEAREGYRLSKAEAKSSFKDDRLLIEKFIVDPRHIEIQVMGDKHGNAVWLNERECSIQRRNQKVLEEAPSVVLDPETRRRMGEQAVALAKAVGYSGAGTVEMMVDKNKNFYFLEMNTRLQVEHPVTEYITGFDLVEMMLHVSAGHPLPITQDDVKINGWAMEARVYAEDPYNNFLPSIGRLTRYVEPDTVGGNVRSDAGVVEGSEISIYYDPLISKLVAYGKDRNEAIERLKTALDSYVIRGVTNNVSFLRAILSHPRYVSGNITTGFIKEEFPQGFKGYQLNETEANKLVSIAAALRVHRQQLANSISSRLGSAPSVIDSGDKTLFITINGKDHEVHINPFQDENFELPEDLPAIAFTAEVNGATHQVELDISNSHGLLNVYVDGEPLVLQVLASEQTGLTLQYHGSAFAMKVLNSLEHRLNSYLPVKVAPDTSKLLISPMPGEVTQVLVQVGSTVSAGQGLCIVEAMKMQNVLRSSRTGKVAKIHVKPGQVVAVEQILLELE